jgi:putative transcription factor
MFFGSVVVIGRRKFKKMNCELCGSGIHGEPQAVNIDGGIFRVCNSCAHLGTPARVPGRPNRSFSRSGGFGSGGAAQRQAGRGIPSARPPPRTNTAGPASASYEEQQVELTQDYSKIIKGARELLGLSQEELGMKINEKPSVISHMETGSMKPSDALARKLEHFLKVQLFVPIEEIEGER